MRFLTGLILMGCILVSCTSAEKEETASTTDTSQVIEETEEITYAVLTGNVFDHNEEPLSKAFIVLVIKDKETGQDTMIWGVSVWEGLYRMGVPTTQGDTVYTKIGYGYQGYKRDTTDIYHKVAAGDTLRLNHTFRRE